MPSWKEVPTRLDLPLIQLAAKRHRAPHDVILGHGVIPIGNEFSDFSDSLGAGNVGFGRALAGDDFDPSRDAGSLA